MLPMLIPMVMKNWKLFAVIGVILAIIGTVGLAYWHYTSLIDEVAELKVSTATLELEKEIQQGHITQLDGAVASFQANEKRIQEKIKELAQISRVAKAETRRLNALFSKHNFGKLAARKPGLIEKRVNRGTANVFRVLRCETGNVADCRDSTAKP